MVFFTALVLMGSFWWPPATVPAARTGTNLNATIYQDDLWLAWHGDPLSVEVSCDHNGRWTTHSIPGASTLDGIGLAADGSTLYASWSSAGKAQRDAVLLSTYDSSQSSWSTPTAVPGAVSNTDPALTMIGDTLWVAWRDLLTDDIDLSSYINGTWTPVVTVPGASTLHRPGLTSRDDKLYLTWIDGTERDAVLDFTAFDPSTDVWGPRTRVDTDVWGVGVSLTSDGGHLIAVWDTAALLVAYATYDPATGVWDHRGIVPDSATDSGAGVTADGDNLVVTWKQPSMTSQFTPIRYSISN